MKYCISCFVYACAHLFVTLDAHQRHMKSAVRDVGAAGTGCGRAEHFLACPPFLASEIAQWPKQQPLCSLCFQVREQGEHVIGGH